MKLIVIRGLPGTGKTIISEILGKIFLDSEVICVDKFKLQAMKNKKKFEESQKIAYEKTLKKLNSLDQKGREYVILDEIICDENFYNELKGFVNETGSKAYWFRLLRPLEKLLEHEAERKRKTKNTREDFENLKRDVESFKIENEVLIKNDNIALTIKKILDIMA